MNRINLNDPKNIDELSVAAIRSMCIDCINKSKSGHPGMALSSAPILYELFKDYIVANPEDPNWINRDRFVLSSGHASILLYTILHLSGYKISKEDLMNFRQLGSITPGHPEVGLTPGIDASSGPLGQGIAEAVGISMAEQMLEAQYDPMIYNHYTYCLCGDGCLEEGISEEAIQYAGFQKLNKLILLYDKNDVTLDGPLAQSENENFEKRFSADGWNVVICKDGNDVAEIKKAIFKAKTFINNQPTVVIFTTTIGYGSINQGTSKVHGAPLGEEDGKHAKEVYGYEYPNFTIPDSVYKNMQDNFVARGLKAYDKYQKLISNLREADPHAYKKLMDLSTNDVTNYLNNEHLPMNEVADESTRITSQKVLNYYHNSLFNLVGGSADVAGSVMTKLTEGSNFTPDNRKGTNINWGIREFLMCAASNGILLHGGLRTYCGCFLIFSDYAKNAIRMAALMKVPQIFLFSHDTIAVGEDGPSHQPIEQLAGLRATPNLHVFRPCDAKETYASWRLALESTKTPSAIIISRQGLPLLNNSSNYDGVKKGGYIVSDSTKKEPDFTIIATGSEVSLALDVKDMLKDKKIDVRVVSLPCFELFDEQSEEYKKSILGSNYEKRMSIEMSSTFGWGKYAKYNYGLDEFGASGKAGDLFKHFKFTKEDVFEAIINCLK
jgi:transketolase, bacterial and yeast